jgi:hypothetical protein
MKAPKPKIPAALWTAAIALWFSAAAGQQQPSANDASAGHSYQVTVNASQLWVDTNIDLPAGAQVHITASGEITYPPSGKTPERKFGPAGLARGFLDLIHQYPAADAGHGALIGRLGPANAAQPFSIGDSKDFTAPVPGRLFVGINQGTADAADAQGSFQVTLNVASPANGSAPAAALVEKPVKAVTPALLAKIPRRVTDAAGDPGDMVNILLVGSEDEVVQAFTTAGWVKVDASVQNAVVSGLLNTLEKKAYLTMPMSQLYLFKRPQDYGFAHAEPLKVAMTRHHLRVWKSPYQVEGQPLWCVAATHDTGIERDQRNNGITHKIDPAVDDEREYVNATLAATGLVAQLAHVTPPDPVSDAKTATGGSFHSDGRILVMVLKKAIGKESGKS